MSVSVCDVNVSCVVSVNLCCQCQFELSMSVCDVSVSL